MALCLWVTGIAPRSSPECFGASIQRLANLFPSEKCREALWDVVAHTEEISGTYFAWDLKKISELAGLLSLSSGAKYMLLGVPKKMGVKS